MDKKSIGELRRRLKKDSCTFTKMCGCYVNDSKNKVIKLDETFLNLEDEEYYKYLEIAKKFYPQMLEIIYLNWISHLKKNSREAISSSF